MTTKAANPQHVVVDGSNIATEGRSMPSLAQLNEAVNSYIADHPGVRVTVVVDATFGHRIATSEVREFDAAVANNELVAPPAGAIGRGDAFVLSIAKKAKATILSNDSFQEFHGEHDWLFDDGRLIGGKPVPHVGWVWVERSPVRGPISRKAVRASRSPSSRREAADGASAVPDREPAAGRGSSRRVRKEATAPMPVPTLPPPGRAVGARAAPPTQATSVEKAPSAPHGDAVNELMPFLDFVQHHPVGTSVNAIVDSYSSHGAYVKIGDILGYVPLRLMSDPPPRSAREVMKIGDAVTLVVASFAPARRSIDCAVPNMASVVEPQDGDAVVAEAAHAAGRPAKRTSAKKAAAKKPDAPPAKAATKKVAPPRVVKKAAAPSKAAARQPAVPKTTAAGSVKKAAPRAAPRRAAVAEAAVPPARKRAGKNTAGRSEVPPAGPPQVDAVEASASPNAGQPQQRRRTVKQVADA